MNYKLEVLDSVKNEKNETITESQHWGTLSESEAKACIKHNMREHNNTTSVTYSNGILMTADLTRIRYAQDKTYSLRIRHISAIEEE